MRSFRMIDKTMKMLGDKAFWVVFWIFFFFLKEFLQKKQIKGYEVQKHLDLA